MNNTYNTLAYDSHDQMIFGKAIHPVSCGHNVVLGSGLVFPEVNFTLPPTHIDTDEKVILAQYTEMIDSILSRMVTLGVPGVVLEFEQLPHMTQRPEFGADITFLIKEKLSEFHVEHALAGALRTTICDIREEVRPPLMRQGEFSNTMLKSFELNAAAGADLLSIESIGGKDLSDQVLLEANAPGILSALGTLAPRDMHWLWSNIVRICAAHPNTLPAGDSACAFANTAMVLADKKYIPEVLATVVRAMSAVRSLAAYEEGAVGPSKDCAYEGPVIKAITGTPISMEGKSSACAHFSHLGNVASAVTDLWSNESVQNVRLLSGYAPEVFSEILAYDCRLMNKASDTGTAEMLRDLFIESDASMNMQACIITPENSFRIAESIVSETDDFLRTRAAGLTACEILREADKDGEITLSEQEKPWLDMIEQHLNDSVDEMSVLETVKVQYGHLFLPEEYGL